MKFAVLGGDMRQIKLAEAFVADGYDVSTFALGERAPFAAASVADALENADCVILPLPAESGAGVLNAPLSKEQYELRGIIRRIGRESVICAARPSSMLVEVLSERGFAAEDYSEREEFAVLNAVATAEGAIQTMMQELPVTISGLKCLVIGYGRVGKVMAHKLRGCGAEVSVSARRDAHKAWIRVMGYKSEDTGALRGRLEGYDAVINTVPALVLTRELLSELKEGCLCIDLASKPGGIDFPAAAELGIKALWELGIPGKVAPVTSGIIIKETVLNILRERGKFDVKA